MVFQFNKVNKVNHNPKRPPSEAVKLIPNLNCMLAKVFQATLNLKPQRRAMFANTCKHYARIHCNSHARACPKAFINLRLISDKS
jgi:hypothetical protein